MDDKKFIKYTTSEQQISILKGKGLKFDNEKSAAQSLNEYGYYNIINGYKSPYVKIINGEKVYIPGTTFEQIFSLFLLDYNLRNSIIAAMLGFEEHLRAIAADVLAKSFGTDHNEYLNRNNYRDRRVTKQRFCLDGILKTLRKNTLSEKDPIKYYRENYGIVPPWILFKGTYLSTLVNFIRAFKAPQKQALIQKLYPVTLQNSNLPSAKKLLSDTLFMCLEYRNLSAHGGRIYNYIPDNKLQLSDEIYEIIPKARKQYIGSNLFQGFSQLLFSLSLFNNDKPHTIISDTFHTEINRHCNVFMEDASFLQEITGVRIIRKHVVYVSDNTKKFHLNPYCSGIRNSYYIPYEAALSKGYTPCKRCVKDTTI